MYFFRAGQSVELDFNTTKTDGTLITFASGAVKIYRGSDTTGSSTGVTLTIDAGGTGEHHITVSPVTAAAYLLPGNIFTVRATAGTIDSIAATDAILATFKVERISAGIEYVLSASSVNGGTLTDNGLRAAADNGDIIVVESGTYPGQPRNITAVNKSTGVFTVNPAFDNDPSTVTVTVYKQAPAPTANVGKFDLIDAPNATAIAAFKTGLANLTALLSAGTGAGQLDFTSGVVKANLAQILGTALTETAGLLAGGFKKFFNVSTPAATMDHGVLVDTVTTTTTATNVTNAPTAGDLTAAMKASVTTAATAATPTAAAVTAVVSADVTKVAGHTVTGDGTATPFHT